jgi:hypothetical protein
VPTTRRCPPMKGYGAAGGSMLSSSMLSNGFI